jgi:adenylate kinase family enzyme
MQDVVLGFAGRIGSGKSTVARAIAARLGWPVAAFGEYVRAVAKSRGLPDKREVLQEVGKSLVRGDSTGFCQAVLNSCGWKPGAPAVVEGIRHEEIVRVLHHLAEPLPFVLVFVNTPEDEIVRRIVRKDIHRTSDLHGLESHSTEREVTTRLSEIADLEVDGTKPPMHIVDDVLNWVENHATDNRRGC